MVSVFIDASNLWQAQKAKGRMLDYKKLKSYLEYFFDTKEIDVFYYSAYPADGTRSYSLDGKHKFYTYLAKGLGFVVRKKELKQIRVAQGTQDRVQEKGNMDVEMTLDAVRYMDTYDRIALFTGDSDFLALLTYLRSKGKKVYIFSSRNNISQELREGGDTYVDVLRIKEDIWGKYLRHRRK